MDGVMFMHSPRLASIREVLDDGKSVGRIRRISSAFSFYSSDENFFQKNIRTSDTLEPAGSLGDLGWYSIRFTLWALGWRLPKTVTGKILSQSSATGESKAPPLEFSGELFFNGEISASFFSSFLTGRQQWAHVSGQQGCFTAPGLWPSPEQLRAGF